MEHPYGHSHHHNHRRNDNDDDDDRHHHPGGGYPQYPPTHSQPPFPGGAYPHAPPSDSYPPFSGGQNPHAPPPDSYPPFSGGAYPHAPPPDSYPPYSTGAPPYPHHPPPPESYAAPPVSGYHAPVAGVVSHSHHGSSGGHDERSGHHFGIPMPGFIQGHFHSGEKEDHSHGHGHGHGRVDEGGDDRVSRYFEKKPTFRVLCKAGGERYSLAVRKDKVVLAQHNPDDLTQHWYKDEKWSTKVKDEEGYPSFALVSKATGEAAKYSVADQPVTLIPFIPKDFDESILWTESKDLGQGFRTIRMVNNVKLCMDAFHGDEGHGGVHEGTAVALYGCWHGDNQQWKIVPYSY